METHPEGQWHWNIYTHELWFLFNDPIFGLPQYAVTL